MVNHHTRARSSSTISEIPADTLVGEEGKGFRYILDGMNAERVLTAAEAIGKTSWFIRTATDYAKERGVFDRRSARTSPSSSRSRRRTFRWKPRT